jgi:molybdopterin molybdotransferase
MITIIEAYTIITRTVQPLCTGNVNLNAAAGRTLAQDVLSDMDMPPFNKSAVDGYACRREDLDKPLKVIEMIPAGYFPKEKIVAGTCSKIMTGAKVPDGASCVVMVEQTKEENGYMHFSGTTSSNFALQGEDAIKGQKLLQSGTLIRPQHIAVMASAGCTQPLVYKQPSIAIFATGNELVEPSAIPGPGQIRNSNGYQTLSQCLKAGFNAVYSGIIPDDPDLTFRTLSDATDKYDVVILSGGVSMGDLDFIPSVMKKLGFRILFDSLAVQPGKPTTLAEKDNKYILGLPGNPVSSLVQFNLIGKKLIYQLSGFDYLWDSYPLKMAHSYVRKKTERTGFVPVTLNENSEIELLKYNGSAHIQALPVATGFLMVNEGTSGIKQGEYGTYRPL